MEKFEVAFTLAMIERAERKCLKFGKQQYGMVGGLSDLMGEEAILHSLQGAMSLENTNNQIIWRGRQYDVKAKHQSITHPLHQDEMMTVMMHSQDIRNIMADPNNMEYFAFVSVYGSSLIEDNMMGQDIRDYAHRQAILYVGNQSYNPVIIDLYNQWINDNSEQSFDKLKIGILLSENDFFRQIENEWWIYTKAEIIGYMSKKAYFDQAWPVAPGCYGIPARRLTKFSERFKTK